MAKQSARAQRERLRRELLASGGSYREVATELAARFRERPRTAWRYTLGWTQWKLVQELRTTRPGFAVGESRVSEWESWPHGGARPPLEVLAALAETFGHGCRVADLVDDTDLTAMSSAERQLVTASRDDARSSSTPNTPSGTPVRAAAPMAQHAATMASFRIADQQVGGGHLYPAVAAYLSSCVAGDLLDVSPNDGQVFTAAAALSEMAGWMAHDAGDDDLAARHFTRALHLSTIDAEPQVRAHLMASAAHLALHRGESHRASALASGGIEVLGKHGAPQVRARLLTMHARAAADVGDVRDVAKALAAAESTLSRRTGDEPLSQWVSGFDAASFSMEAARSFRVSGDVTAAREHAERVVALRHTGRARARAFGRLMVAATSLDAGHPDEAAEITADVVHSTGHLRSHVLTAQVRDIGRRLEQLNTGGAIGETVALIKSSTSARTASVVTGPMVTK